MTNGFLLDRARLVVSPVGLDHVVHLFMQRGLCSGGAGLDFGRKIVQRLRDVLRQDGRTSHLETCLDGPFHFHMGDQLHPQKEIPTEEVAGLTPWEATAPVKSQFRVGGTLHGLTDHGTLALFVPPERSPNAEEVREWLRTACQQTEVVRLRLVQADSAHQQLTFGG